MKTSEIRKEHTLTTTMMIITTMFHLLYCIVAYFIFILKRNLYTMNFQRQCLVLI